MEHVLCHNRRKPHFCIPPIPNLNSNYVGVDGARALSELNLSEINQAPSLCTLDLNLRYNEVGNEGACALSQLKYAPSLHTLSLNLNRNRVGDAGAVALSQLKESRSLHTLTLSLRCNPVGVDGADALSQLHSFLPTFTCIIFDD
eukprot:NODE_4256_length_817_cov_29.224638_g4098_i0.p1 GENE.NODE_4256_length_817_cov_29.224638_g4098_i0~~NODE_4256_length_817_cov_29.224638_g4098_i0.p1  ORF type:complete len:145 (+),score=20.66 NODE_4256_length_817_cov_29.224638_g4098_i0:303-737(+)